MRPHIVLLPGMDGTGLLLAPLAAKLSEQFAVKTVRYPEDGPQPYAALADHARRALGDSPLVLVGESFSGPIAISLAANDNRVVGLVLASTFARSPLPAWLARFRFAVPLLPRWMVRLLLLSSMRTSPVSRELERVLEDLAPTTLRERAAAAMTVDVRDEIANLACPRLVLIGNRDRLIPCARTRELLDSIRQSHVEQLELDAPHMLLETNASEAAAGIALFCDKVAERRLHN